ncbi:MAG: hypothetical protein ABI576_13955 [Flavobacterium sp.]
MENTSHSKHFIFITDNDGMNNFFPMILKMFKNETEEDNHFTVLYLDETYNYVFKEELEILVQRFTTQILVQYRAKFQDETIEAIMNTNTKKQIKFYVETDAITKDKVLAELQFLGVDTNNVQTKIS